MDENQLSGEVKIHKADLGCVSGLTVGFRGADLRVQAPSAKPPRQARNDFDVDTYAVFWGKAGVGFFERPWV